MQVDLLSGALGAEIAGIDLKDLSDRRINLIEDLLREHKVVFFRDQQLNSEDHLNLANCFGQVEKHSYVLGRDDYPEIVRIIKEPHEQNNWAEGWHSDASYHEKPTGSIILKAVEIPPVGGDTAFANMELAWETLPTDIKRKIDGKKAIHDSQGAEFFTTEYASMLGNGNNQVYRYEHPIVRAHPETGKQSLYVNEMYTRRIVGCSPEESREILGQIFQHQARIEFSCRFKWSPHAVAFWDNRSVIHQAIADYFPGRGLGYRRVMDRVAILGEQPY